MKKIYTIIMLFAPLAYTAHAQSKIASSSLTEVSVKPIAKSGNPSVLVMDTLVPPSFGSPVMCDSAPKLYGWQPPATGHVYGNNSYGETECAEKYYATGTVNEVLVWHGYKKGTTGTTTVKIYTIDPITKGPSATVLGTSAVITTGNISTTAYASYTFTPTVAVTGSFAASVVFPTTSGDSVGVVSTAIGCATSDSLSWIYIAKWISTPSAISGHPNADLWILPVGTLTSTSGVNEYSAPGLSLLGAYPNPAQDFTNIRFRTDESSNVSIEVFDLSGRVLQHSSEKLVSGTHDIKVSLKDVAAGNYYYTIKTGSAVLTSKFIVTK